MKRTVNLSIFTMLCFILTNSPSCLGAQIANYLLISPSTQANAMGQTFGAVTSSPLTAIMSPASAGLFAQNNDWGIEFFPGNVDWLQDYGSGIVFNAQALCLGIRLKNTEYPVALGITLFQTRYEYDGLYNNIITYEGPEPLYGCSVTGKSRGVGLSAAVDLHPLILSVGVNLKSVLINSWSAHSDYKTQFAWDYGFILDLPLFNTVNKRGYSSSAKYQPFFTPGLFISNTNIGDDFTKKPHREGYCLPRSIDTGVHIKTGIIHHWRRNRIKLFSLLWSREAKECLTEYGNKSNIVNHYGFHNIDFYKHILCCKAGDDIVTQKGYEIGLADVFFWRGGRYEDLENNAIYKTSGWGLDVSQSIKLLATLLRKSSIPPNWFTQIHITINHVQYKTDSIFHPRMPQYYLPLPNANMTSITISL